MPYFIIALAFFAPLSPVAMQQAGVQHLRLTSAQQAAVVREVQSSFEHRIANPAIARIVPIRQERGYVTATVHFEPHLAEGRRRIANLAFCRQRATLEEWNCVHLWEESWLFVPGQREPVRLGHPVPDAVTDALIAFVRSLPANDSWTLDTADVTTITSVTVSPSGHGAQVMTSTGKASGALIELRLCDPQALEKALAERGFAHPGARSPCGLPAGQGPRDSDGRSLLSENGIAMPVDGSYLLVHHSRGYAALRPVEGRELKTASQPNYSASVELLQSQDGDFSQAQVNTVECCSDHGHRERSVIELPGLRLEWSPPDGFVQIANLDGVIAASRTPWNDRRLLDTDSPVLDWFFVRTDRQNRLWTAGNLPTIQATRIEHFQ